MTDDSGLVTIDAECIRFNPETFQLTVAPLDGGLMVLLVLRDATWGQFAIPLNAARIAYLVTGLTNLSNMTEDDVHSLDANLRQRITEAGGQDE